MNDYSEGSYKKYPWKARRLPFINHFENMYEKTINIQTVLIRKQVALF